MHSIYDGDPCFKELDERRYQYKVDEGSANTFLVEIAWDDDYPNKMPTFSLDAFYNRHLCKDVKDAISCSLADQASALLGSAMTYTLFEWVKENAASLTADQPAAPVSVAASEAASTGSQADIDQDASSKKKEKKDQLSKNQKRRMYDKFGTKGMVDDKPRGWDWVDIVKHLSQTGGAAAGGS